DRLAERRIGTLGASREAEMILLEQYIFLLSLAGR
ncbi:unnamed protein product, partial [marine sediment metagenome]